MKKTILGISAFYHDSAAAIVEDNHIIAAAQEERFSRKKHDPRFPAQAINYCLEEAALEPDELDAIVFYESPLLTWDRVLKNCMQGGSESYDQFIKAARSILGIKLWVKDYVQHAIGSLGQADRLLYSEHHMSHAASAFYPSPFDEAAILTLDGVGEWCTTSIGHGNGQSIELLQEIDYPHSLGLLYSAFTYYCGFKVNSGEYKLMGLAPYGDPVYTQRIKDHLIDIKADGSYRLNMDYFAYIQKMAMINDKFAALFDGPPRQPESHIKKREMDLAASIQQVTTEIVIKMARHARQKTGVRQLVMAGGVALNCVANGELLRANIFDDIWVQPAAGDAGGALGAALAVSHQYFEVARPSPNGKDSQAGSFLGPRYHAGEIKAFLDRHDYVYSQCQSKVERDKIIAQALSDGKVIGYFDDRMEFGPRSLGARSIIGDPRRADTQSTMNLKIKYRESFRPFAPAVLEEDVSEYFDITGERPYMLFIAPVRKQRCLQTQVTAAQDDDMLKIVNQARSDIPAVTHVDYSARIQTVGEQSNPGLYGVIKEFKNLTGFSVVVNTSFNVRGEPIVCTPKDAYTCFMRTEMELLVLQDYLLWKEQQPIFEDQEDWMSQYDKD